MPIIQRAVSEFIVKLLPEIYDTIYDGIQNNQDRDEIYTILLGKNFSVSQTRSEPEKKPSTTKKTSTLITIEEYQQKIDDNEEPTCSYIATRGESKDKVCNSAVKKEQITPGQVNSYRCSKHLKSPTQDFSQKSSEILGGGSSKSASSQASKVRNMPKGTPTCVSGKSSMKDGLTGSTGGNISSRLKNMMKPAKKATEPEEEPEEVSEDPQGGPAEPKASSEASDDEESSAKNSRESTKSKTRDTSVSKSRTPVRMTRVKEFARDIPLDDNSENLYITPSLPEARKYVWKLMSDNEFFIFNKDEDVCYGRYVPPEDAEINLEEKLHLSTAWKTRVAKHPLKDYQVEYLESIEVSVEELP